MTSQFFGLNIAYTGLLASNAAMNTTANNIANVQTDGYSRQHVNQQAANALRVFQTYGCAGAGVETLSIERIRDEFYDGKYWANNSHVGEYTQKAYYMQQIETYFEDNGENAGFKTVFDRFMVNALEELMKNPSSESTKAQFAGAAGDLTEYFNGLVGNMEALQKDVNQEIKLKIDQINSIASEIASLNKQINTIELSSAGKANELRDRRTNLIDELSEIVDVNVTEIPIIDPDHPDRVTGANRFMVKSTGGGLLVDGNDYNGLICVAREPYEKLNQTDIDGLYDVYWEQKLLGKVDEEFNYRENGQKFNLSSGALQGALKGLVDMRDGNNGEYFHGDITGLSKGSATDPADTRQRVTITVNKDTPYLTDLNKCNLSDQGGIIQLGDTLYYYDEWTYNRDASGNVSYDFVISSERNDSLVGNEKLLQDAKIGVATNYQGIPYYLKQVNEWVRTFSEKFNDILKAGVTSDNINGVNMFTGDHAVEGQFLLEDTVGGVNKKYYEDGAVSVAVNDDSYYRLTGKNFAIFGTIENNPQMMATKYSTADGVEKNNDLLSDLKVMAFDKTKISFRGASASEFLTGVLSDVALHASRANSFKDCYSDILNTIDNQRISISGVDEDEEAVNLVKYQNAYNLASKMIQTLTEIYDRLILQTGV